jgi:hypothetical protein
MSMASIICALFSGSCSASTLHSNHGQKQVSALDGADMLNRAPVLPSEIPMTNIMWRLASDMTISEMFFTHSWAALVQ